MIRYVPGKPFPGMNAGMLLILFSIILINLYSFALLHELFIYSFHRANKNVVLATLKHGGHLAFFEGITASSLW